MLEHLHGLISVISALGSRYSTITLLPYFIALGSQLLASLYAAVSIPETVQDKDDDKSEGSGDEGSNDGGEDDEDEEGGLREAVEQTMETVVAPVKPLGLLAPYRSKETGRIEWRLFLVTVSLLSTTIGVSLTARLLGVEAVRVPHGTVVPAQTSTGTGAAAQSIADIQTVFIATASLLYLSDKFNFQPEEVWIYLCPRDHQGWSADGRTAGSWHTSPSPASSTSSSSSRSYRKAVGHCTTGTKSTGAKPRPRSARGCCRGRATGSERRRARRTISMCVRDRRKVASADSRSSCASCRAALTRSLSFSYRCQRRPSRH